jgi:hypothetical protein
VVVNPSEDYSTLREGVKGIVLSAGPARGMPGSAPGEIAPESEADAGRARRRSNVLACRASVQGPAAQCRGGRETRDARGRAGQPQDVRGTRGDQAGVVAVSTEPTRRTPPLGVRRSHLEKIPRQAGVGPDRAVQSLECLVREGE